MGPLSHKAVKPSYQMAFPPLVLSDHIYLDRSGGFHATEVWVLVSPEGAHVAHSCGSSDMWEGRGITFVF